MLRQLIRLMIVLMLVVLVGVVQAQDETPPPAESNDPAMQQSTQILFPQAIRFTFAIDLPADQISSIILTIQRRGVEQFVREIDPDDSRITEPYTELDFDWDVRSVSELPTLFTEVIYRWQVVTTTNQTYTTGDTVVFTDVRRRWVTDEDPDGHINITMPQGHLAPNLLRRAITPAYELIQRNTRSQPTFDLLILDSNLTLGCNLDAQGEPVVRLVTDEGTEQIPCDLELAQFIYDSSPYVILTADTVPQFTEQFQPLLVAGFYDPLWGEVAVPEWFRYGLAQFYRTATPSTVLSIAQQASRSDRLYTLEELNEIPSDPDELEVWQAQSYGMVLYTADQIGVDDFFDLANDIASAESFAEAYQDALDIPLEVLPLQWESWLFSRRAESAYLYNPYMVNTPTPTPTATDTLTPTVTPTWTFTPDFSPTPTATRTPIPPTPTITPLPARSFEISQPTATPVPVQPTASPLDSIISLEGALVIGGIFLLLAIVSFIYLRMRRNSWFG